MKLETEKWLVKVMAQYGYVCDTVLATVTAAKEPREDVDFFHFSGNTEKNITLVVKSRRIFQERS